jgi:hypothetical protein
MYLIVVKAICDKPIANIILNGDKLKPFPLWSGKRQGCPLSLLLFNIVLEFLAREIRLEEKIKGIQIGKETDKVFLFADDLIIINSFSNVSGYKNILQKSVAFYTTTMNKFWKNTGKQFNLQ